MHAHPDDTPQADARFTRHDTAVMVLLAVVAAALVWVGHALVGPYSMHESTWDVWFESDPPAVAEMMTNRWGSVHYRLSHHPIFTLVVFPVVLAFRKVFGATPSQAMAATLMGVAALWVATIFVTLRAMRLRRVDAALFTALAMVSASAVFWFPVTESFSFGALTIMLAVAATALSERYGTLPLWTYVLVAVATLSMTTTNWMVGLAMLVVVLPFPRAVLAGTVSAALTAALWLVQRVLVPNAGNPLVLSSDVESTYVFNENALGALSKIRTFFVHSVTMPEPVMYYGQRLSVQPALPGEGSAMALIAAVLWAALLALGVWSAPRTAARKTMIVLGLALAGQLLLHLVFGVETFLYSAHWVGLLIVLSAAAALTSARRFAIPVCAALVAVGGWNNLTAFQTSAARLRGNYERERVFSQELVARTGPDDRIACGREAAATVGLEGRARPTPADAPETDLIFERDRLGAVWCAFRFDDTTAQRRGWIIPFEDWSLDAIETLRSRGARYFATPYAYGVAQRPALFGELAQRYRTVERNEQWVLFDLSQPASPPLAPPLSPPSP